MSTKAGLFFLLASSSALFCQTSSSSRPELGEGGKVYVRRFSLGVTLTVPGLSLMPRGSANPITQNPPVDSLYTAQNAAYRLGYGIMAQVLIKGRFAVNASLLLRRVGYKLNSDIIEGVDNPNTVEDERTYIVRNEDTRAKFVDLPVTLRYYVKDRRAPGARFFVEGGAALRRAYRVRTSIDETVNAGTTTCCQTTPASTRRTVRGLVAGLGVQLIEPMGIRIIPAFRYTRWLERTFDSAPTPSRRDQIEGMVSLSF